MHEDMSQFLAHNGHSHVDIVLNSSNTEWFRFRPKYAAYTRTVIKNLGSLSKTVFQIFVYEPDLDNDLKTYLEIIIDRKNGMSLLLFTKGWSQNGMEKLQFTLKSLEARIFFYVAVSSENEKSMYWYQVISLKSGSAINEINFYHNSRRIVKRYDLKGLEITSTSLTWAPFYTLEDCNEHGLQCKSSYGYLKDYMDLLANKFNFSYVSHKDLDNDWGTLPKAGPFSLNGTWSGVVGDVILKKYDMSISSYTWNVARSELMQFVPIVRTRRMLALTPQRPAMDFGLFLRAFTYYSWAGIICMTVTAAVCVVVGSVYCSGPKRDTVGNKILAFTIWTFFVIINAYYGGN